jgi:hypothetical protein
MRHAVDISVESVEGPSCISKSPHAILGESRNDLHISLLFAASYGRYTDVQVRAALRE